MNDAIISCWEKAAHDLVVTIVVRFFECWECFEKCCDVRDDYLIIFRGYCNELLFDFNCMSRQHQSLFPAFLWKSRTDHRFPTWYLVRITPLIVEQSTMWVVRILRAPLLFFFPSNLLSSPFFSLSLLAVTQIRGHVAGSSSSSPLRLVRALRS